MAYHGSSRLMARMALAACSSLLICCTAAKAATYHTLYTFGGPPDASTPNGGLIKDSTGRLYGVSFFGGTYGFGSIYRLTRAVGSQTWTEEVLHSFNGTDGAYPSGALSLGPSGELYGSASGFTNNGTVYRLDSTGSGWVLTVLHAFTAQSDGGSPFGAPILGTGGLLYGTTRSGGLYNAGTVYSISPHGDAAGYQIIHTFGSAGDGSYPEGPLYSLGQGFVGTTNGSPGLATVFTLSMRATGEWTEKPIASFSGIYVAPVGNIVRGKNGILYGCASGGLYNQGDVYALQHTGPGNAPWSQSTIYNFGATENDASVGDGPELCGLTMNPAGQILGTASEGGTKGTGAFFELTPPSSGVQWTETVLHNFSFGAPKGAYPVGAPLRSGNNYYGAASNTKEQTASFGGTTYDLNPTAVGQN